MAQITPEELKKLAKDKQKENNTFYNKLKKSKPKKLDSSVHELHRLVFEEVDCLSCANCCKSISPMITNRDIDKIAKYLKTKPANIVEKYMHIDKDGDYVFNEAPCPFLLPDNYCLIYEARPKACAGYPHTDRKKFYQLLELTKKNSFICPAVYLITEKLKNQF